MKQVLIDKPTFTPQINTISNRLDPRSKSRCDKPNRWEALYELGEKQKQDYEFRRKQQQEEQLQKDNCPFRPQLVMHEKSGKTDPSVAQRTSQWNQMKEEKVKAMEAMKKEKELEGCTFKPKLVTHVGWRTAEKENMCGKPGMKSIEKHVVNQNKARIVREEKKKMLEQAPGSGNVWARRGTVPRTPSFMKRAGSKVLL